MFSCWDSNATGEFLIVGWPNAYQLENILPSCLIGSIYLTPRILPQKILL
jgi:hypothetical protein